MISNVKFSMPYSSIAGYILFLVEVAALVIVEPSVFEEIAHHACGVCNEQAQASVRTAAELVVY